MQGPQVDGQLGLRRQTPLASDAFGVERLRPSAMITFSFKVKMPDVFHFFAYFSPKNGHNSLKFLLQFDQMLFNIHAKFPPWTSKFEF